MNPGKVHVLRTTAGGRENGVVQGRELLQLVARKGPGEQWPTRQAEKDGWAFDRSRA